MTEPDAGGERLGLPGRPTPPSLEICVLVLAQGEDLSYEPADWRDALIEVDSGELEIEFRSGARGRFGAGALLWLDGLYLRALHNPVQQPTVLVAMSRSRRVRGPDEPSASGRDEKTNDCRLDLHDDYYL